jgi:hypothetical protein
VRRDFTLPSEDLEWLESLKRPFELVSEGGAFRVLLHSFPVPPGYNVAEVDATVRIDPGYPDAQIDMVYFFPALSLRTGAAIAALCTENFLGRSWQRWSRHRTPANPWRPGIDNLATHFALVSNWLDRESRKAK